MEISYTKVIRTGHVLEVYTYEKPPPDNTKAYEWGDDDNFPYWDIYETERDPFTADKDWIKDRETLKKEWSRGNSIKRRNKVRRLITANFNEHSKFITLTFRENITDLDRANREFKKFIQRMRRKYGKFKYLAVIEFQQRGAVHYHMISDLPYIKKQKLADIWRHGFVRINDIEHVDNVGAYVVKYMTKESDNPLLRSRKTYLPCRGLIQPEEIGGDTGEAIAEDLRAQKKCPVFTNEYETEMQGACHYAEYNLKRF